MAGPSRRPLLCTVTQIGDRGGIARVSILLWKALQERLKGACDVITLLPEDATTPALVHKLRFAGSVVGRQMQNRTEWILFDHLQLASVQHLLIPPVRRPYGVFLHSIEAWNPLSSQRKRALRNAAVRIANSSYTANRIATAHPDIGPIAVCPLALPGEVNMNSGGIAMDAVLLNQLGQHVILIVGRMDSAEGYKGQDLLIKAWPLVTESIPSAQLVIVGRGDDAPRLQQMAKGDPRILFTGPVTEDTLHALYARAAVFAMPSLLEGFGLVYLEAMQHRLPCIGSTADAAGEVIANGETGLLVDRQDIPALAGVIVRFLADPSLRKRMGDAGYARLQTTFSYQTFRDRLFTALQPLIEWN